jgi:thioesterase domain-containing protein
MRRTAKSIPGRLAGRPAPPDPDAGGPQFPHAAAHVATGAHYRPRRCELPTLVVRSSAQPITRLVGDATLGWRALVGDKLSVLRIPGDHDGMVSEPGVRRVAAALAQALDRVQS